MEARGRAQDRQQLLRGEASHQRTAGAGQLQVGAGELLLGERQRGRTAAGQHAGDRLRHLVEHPQDEVVADRHAPAYSGPQATAGGAGGGVRQGGRRAVVPDGVATAGRRQAPAGARAAGTLRHARSIAPAARSPALARAGGAGRAQRRRPRLRGRLSRGRGRNRHRRRPGRRAVLPHEGPDRRFARRGDGRLPRRRRSVRLLPAGCPGRRRSCHLGRDLRQDRRRASPRRVPATRCGPSAP